MAEGENSMMSLEIVKGKGVVDLTPKRVVLDSAKGRNEINMKPADNFQGSAREIGRKLAKFQEDNHLKANDPLIIAAEAQKLGQSKAEEIAFKGVGILLAPVGEGVLQNTSAVESMLETFAINPNLLGQMEKDIEKKLKPGEPYYQTWKDGQGAEMIKLGLEGIVKDLQDGDGEILVKLRQSREAYVNEQGVNSADKATEQSYAKWKTDFLSGNSISLGEQELQEIFRSQAKWADGRKKIMGLDNLKSTSGVVGLDQVARDIRYLVNKKASGRMTASDQEFLNNSLDLRGQMFAAAREGGLVPADISEKTAQAIENLNKKGIELDSSSKAIDPKIALQAELGKLGIAKVTGGFAGLDRLWTDATLADISVRQNDLEDGFRKFLGMPNTMTEEQMNLQKEQQRVTSFVFSDEYNQAVTRMAELGATYQQVGPQEKEYQDAIVRKFAAAAPGTSAMPDNDFYRRSMAGVTEADLRVMDAGSPDEKLAWVRERLRRLVYKRTSQRSSAALEYFSGRQGEKPILTDSDAAAQGLSKEQYVTPEEHEVTLYAEDRQEVARLDDIMMAADGATGGFADAAARFSQEMVAAFGPEKVGRLKRLSREIGYFAELEDAKDVLRDYMLARGEGELYGEKLNVKTGKMEAEFILRDPVTGAPEMDKRTGTPKTVVKESVRGRMMEALGVDEVDLNTILMMYDITLRRSTMDAYGDTKAVRWQYRGGTNFAKLMNYGQWKFDKAATDPVLAEKWNMGFGDMTMMVTDRIMESPQVNLAREYGVSMGDLSQSYNEAKGDYGLRTIDWERASKAQGSIVREWMDYMNKTIATQAAFDGWLKDGRDWKGLGGIMSSMRHLQSNPMFITNEGWLVNEKIDTTDTNYRFHRIVQFAVETLVAQDMVLVASGKNSYKVDSRALALGLRQAFTLANAEPDMEKELEMRTQLERTLERAAAQLKPNLSELERKERFQSTIFAIFKTLGQQWDSITEVKILRQK